MLAPGVMAKASYEYATRLPSPNEIFGDGVLVVPNLALRPDGCPATSFTLGAEL